MSFENGYDIKEYIGKTYELYSQDKEIFNKAINRLNVFMRKNNWPICFAEFEDIITTTLGENSEWICRTWGMFLNACPESEWDKDLEENFKKDINDFCEIINPIINSYYDYLNNPLGLDTIAIFNNYEPNLKRIKIIRSDGESLELKLSKHDIVRLTKTLKEI